MSNIGAEVGQKMRSAIKAKLLELNCYVDDELPDYVMVMVANKRTKSQMKEDLHLFLAAKTTAFVDWLHIVLKKLKEVTVTNPEVYKKTVKRKSEEISNVNVKKEKKDKKLEKKAENEKSVTEEDSSFKSLTDDLPINANKLSEQRKIIIMKENQSNNSAEQFMQDNFNIPLLSEVNMSTEEELEDIERKIKSVKSRLGLLVDSDDGEDCINLKAEPDELFENDKTNERRQVPRKIQLVESTTSTVLQANIDDQVTPKRPERTKITFSNDETAVKRKSILERLGKRRLSEDQNETARSKKNRITVSDFHNEEHPSRFSREKERKSRQEGEKKNDARSRREADKAKESVLNRLGVMSKVSIPQKAPEEPEEPVKGREVPSVVKIKPRVIPHDAPQANKNLLLKAVAEAQRSIAQMPKVGTLKPDALYTKKYKEKIQEEPDGLFTRKYKEKEDSDALFTKKFKEKLQEEKSRRLPEKQKEKIKKILVPARELVQEEQEQPQYVPTSLKTQSAPKYVPRSQTPPLPEEKLPENGKVKQQFIVTLDGIEKTKFKDLKDAENPPKPSIKSRLDKKRSPSPIIFDKVTTTVKTKLNIPDKLPVVHAPSSVKNKEKCRYWPSCRQGEKCEFVHPVTNCEMFPHCKFGDKCLFLHPTCKFGSSCTRRDCCYSHSPGVKAAVARITPSTVSNKQTCKYFPNCTNLSCPFYHPKPCKFGKFCKKIECGFSHGFGPTKSSLTWRPK